MVRVLSSLSLELQVEIDIATWLDRDPISDTPKATRKAGFGREMRETCLGHTRWLVGQGLPGTRQSGRVSGKAYWPPFADAR